MKAFHLVLVTVLLALPVMAQTVNSPPKLSFKEYKKLNFPDFKTTADYVNGCGGHTAPRLGCIAVLGLVQSVPGHPTYCTPDTASRDPNEGKKKDTALIVNVVVWLKQHPAYLNKPYVEGLSAALTGRYPCASGQR